MAQLLLQSFNAMEKNRSKIIAAQVDRETAERLERLATEQERTVSAEIRVALRAHLARQSETRAHQLEEVA